MGDGIWEGAVMLSGYSRAEAIADGVLVDVTAAARAVGLTLPVALTAEALHQLGATDDAQLARVMAALRVAAGLAGDADTVRLALRGRGGRWVDAWATVGPGDDPWPVLTVMLEGEGVTGNRLLRARQTGSTATHTRRVTHDGRLRSPRIGAELEAPPAPSVA